MKYAAKKILVIALVATLFTACSKDGEKGEMGATGPVGPAGPAGPTGPAGVAGSANVIYSDWFSPASWTGSGTQVASFVKAAPGITEDIRTKGIILAYVQFVSDGTSTRPLPATTLNGTTVVFWNYYSNAVGSLTFTCINEGGGLSITPSTTNKYRYVIIPGAVSGGRFVSSPNNGETTYTEEQLRAMSYEELVSKMNIPQSGSNEQ